MLSICSALLLSPLRHTKYYGCCGNRNRFKKGVFQLQLKQFSMMFNWQLILWMDYYCIVHYVGFRPLEPCNQQNGLSWSSRYSHTSSSSCPYKQWSGRINHGSAVAPLLCCLGGSQGSFLNRPSLKKSWNNFWRFRYQAKKVMLTFLLLLKQMSGSTGIP